MSDRSCNKDRDHFDGFSWFVGGFCGFALCLFGIVLPISLTGNNNDNVIWNTDKGLVCKQNEYYPQMDCKKIKVEFGPRLNTLKIKR